MSKQTAQAIFHPNKPLFKALYIGIFTWLISFPLYGQSLSPEQVADIARSTTGGKVLKVKPPRSNNGNYRVKMLLPEGKVKNIIVDGNSGKVKNFPTKK